MEQRISEKTRKNKFAMLGWTITMVIIFVAYLLEVIKGERTVAYFAVLLLAGIVPYVIGQVVFRKDKESGTLRNIIAFGYMVLYTYVLVTGDTVMTFVYVFPILSVILVYCDCKLLRNFTIITIIVNVISVGVKIAVFHMLTADNIADYEIQVLGTMLIMIMSYLACRIMEDVNNEKMSTIEGQASRQEQVLVSIAQATEVLNERVSAMDVSAKGIERQSESAQASIEQIASGTADVAGDVQEQLNMSNGISEELDNLTSISEGIQDKFGETKQMSQTGIKSVDNLSKSAALVEKSKNEVSEATETLNHQLQEAKEILSLIRSVTDQTNLLALNASIEAARAGEHGKGFAVVASEIQKLSGDSGDATDRISDILEALEREANNVNRAVESLGVESNRQNELVKETDEQFRLIGSNIEEMSGEIQRQGEFLTRINANNQQIAGSIANMSSYTEELTASSEDTMNLTRESLDGTKEMASSLNDILEQVQKLQDISAE